MAQPTAAAAPAVPGARADTFRRRPALVAVCVTGAVVESVLLPVFGRGGSRALAPQVTALPPFGVFHDLRWLWVFHDSWWSFAVGLLGVLALRTALTMLLVRLAWPAGLARVPLVESLLSTTGFTALAIVVLSPIVTALFGAAVVPFSWPFLAAVPALVLVAMLIGHGGLVSPWWRGLPTLQTLAWLLVSFLVLTAAGTVIVSVPAPAGVPFAAAAGLFNAWAWYGLTGSLARRGWPHWRLPVTPVTAAALLALIVGGARAGFALASTPQRIGTPGKPPASATGQPVLVVGGFGSSCCLRADTLSQAWPGLRIEQFSFVGLDPQGRPIPHGAKATNAPLSELGDRLDVQLERLHAETGRPVSVVAESVGTLVTYAALARHPAAPVQSVVLLSPIVDPARVSYPLPGREGAGLAAGWQLRGLVRVAGELAPFGVASDQPLIASIAEEGADYAHALLCRSDLPRLSVLPLADALTVTPQRVLDDATMLAVPAFHGGLLGDPRVQKMVLSFLTDHRVRAPRHWRALAGLVSSAGAAWVVPPLHATTPSCG